jgi:hypothetical protein
MQFFYHFFDRNACDQLWRSSWKEYLSRWGKTRWAKGPFTGESTESLRDMISFHIDPQPTAGDVERILAHETIRQTVRRSSPQFGPMSQLLSKTPGFRKYSECIFFKGDYFAVLMAAGFEAYLQGRVSQSDLWPVFKLHSIEDPRGWLRISSGERKTIKAVVSSRRMLGPIYRWQGEGGFLVGDQWSNCLGVADTRRFVALILRAWKENWSVPRLRKVDRISTPPSGAEPPPFRDFELSKYFVEPLAKKVSHFERPCVFFEWL